MVTNSSKDYKILIKINFTSITSCINMAYSVNTPKEERVKLGINILLDSVGTSVPGMCSNILD